MPDLIVDFGFGETEIIDPFVGCVIDLERFDNNLDEINKFIDSELIGWFCDVDLDNCGYNGTCYFPYSSDQFKLT